VRLTSRIPARLGRVASITVRVLYEGTETSDAVDVTDLQLQPGDPSGVVPHPSDVATARGGSRWRNGVITRTTDEVIVLANDDAAAPTFIQVTPAGRADVRVGSFRFGQITGRASANAETGTKSGTTGWGRPPVLTERSDGHVPVITTRPVHLSVGWADRK